jgi:PAS domain S-box-containing protein
MPASARRSVIYRYAGALIITVLSILITLLAQPPLRAALILPVFTAIALSAWLWGRGPAYLALVVGLLLRYIYLLPSVGRVSAPWDPLVLIRVFQLFLICLLTITLINRLRDERDADRIAARDLIAGEERHRILLETANEGIVFFDRDGQVRYANARTLEILEYSAQELVGKNSSELIHPEALAGHRDRRESTLRGERTQADVRLVTRYGDFRWVLSCCSPMRDSEDQIVGTLMMMTDITNRKQAEEELEQTARDLRASEANARLIVETANEGIVHLDREGRILYANARMLELIGATMDQLRGCYAMESVHPEDREEHEARRRDVVENGVRSQADVRLLRSDGAVLWIIASCSPIRNEQGEIVGSLSMVTDITDRKQMEEDLREKEERLRLALETADLNYWDWDVLNDRVIWSVSSHQETYGTVPSTLDEVFALIHPDDREPMRQTMHESLYEGKPFKVRFRTLAQNGQVRWTQTQARVLRDETGAPIRMIGVAADITELQQAVEHLQIVTSKAQALLWYSIVEETDEGELKWTTQFITDSASHRFIPLRIEPGEDYGMAAWLRRTPEEQRRTGRYAEEKIRAGESYSQDYGLQDLYGQWHMLHEDVEVEVLQPGHWRVIGVTTKLKLSPEVPRFQSSLAQERAREIERRPRDNQAAGPEKS